MPKPVQVRTDLVWMTSLIPPHVGWWNASFGGLRNDTWRWWNGTGWSMPVRGGAHPRNAELGAWRADPMFRRAPRGIRWRMYWPADARCCRYNPADGYVTGSGPAMPGSDRFCSFGSNYHDRS